MSSTHNSPHCPKLAKPSFFGAMMQRSDDWQLGCVRHCERGIGPVEPCLVKYQESPTDNPTRAKISVCWRLTSHIATGAAPPSAVVGRRANSAGFSSTRASRR